MLIENVQTGFRRDTAGNLIAATALVDGEAVTVDSPVPMPDVPCVRDALSAALVQAVATRIVADLRR